jgi:HlyD family secretion protein
MRADLFVPVVAVFAWTITVPQIAVGQDRAAGERLISRGLTDASAGTVVIVGEYAGGDIVVELRIKERQKVNRGDIVAVLSNYSKADSAVRIGEGTLAKSRFVRDAILHGTSVTQIALQEAQLETTELQFKLSALQRDRSGKPLDQREIEAKLDEQNLERQRAQLQLAKESLASQQRQMDLDVANTEAWLEGQRQTREQSLVRSPMDGVVVEILARVGERATSAGIAKIVDMGQLRVIADVDETNVNRIAPGGKVEITFRGDPALYKGTIARIAPTVKRMQKVDPGAASSTDARTIEVEIEFDDHLKVPQVLAREARITFL